MPENSIPAFLRAVSLGVDAIELDVVITGDKQVLVSHEAWFSSEICLKPSKAPIAQAEEKQLNIYHLPYNIISEFECGLKPHHRFPGQERVTVSKPLLTDVIDVVEEFIVKNNLPSVTYNIEIKSFPEGDNLFHPSPPVFVNLLMEVLNRKAVISKTMIQSFDIRPLQILYHQYNFKQLGLLVEDRLPVKQHLDALGFLPFAYNPHYGLVHQELVSFLQTQGISIYTWTVNTTKAVKDLIRFKVDGIITDYPMLVQQILQKI